jgi:hypothetical protein
VSAKGHCLLEHRKKTEALTVVVWVLAL